jgi:hypothetical protein
VKTLDDWFPDWPIVALIGWIVLMSVVWSLVPDAIRWLLGG